MSPKRLPTVFVIVAIAGLGLYVWCALAAPVVLWSDSSIDMAWARTGVGIFRPVPPPPTGQPLGHPPKSGYLVFLNLAMRAVPALGPGRSIVLVQSLLLWASLTASGWFIGRRLGAATGAGAALLFFAVFRIRDAASAVMSEAISAALLLVLALWIVWPPRRAAAFAATGVGAAVLFTIRPDFGAILFLIALAGLLRERHWRALAIYAMSFLACALAAWAGTRSAAGPDPLRGVGHPILEASAEYYWRPALGNWPRAPESEMGKREIEKAVENWKERLSNLGPDGRRELVWRAFHGLLGTEFYDARWSHGYEALDTASRIATPFLILAAVAALALGRRSLAPGATLAGVLALAGVVGHDLVFGSNPRYLAPVLAFLLLPLAVAARAAFETPRIRWMAALSLFALLVLVTFWNRQVLDWQWGRIESAGVTIRQPIGRGGLPKDAPATLHIRIAAPLTPTNAWIELAADGRRFWSSEGRKDSARPEITAALPAWLLEENARRGVELELTSAGDYGPYSYLLFPIIPPPWGRAARRDGGSLSPSTGVRTGSLDWWAHEGSDPDPRR